MFESVIATLLNKYLSEYIDAVDYNNLKIGLFSGCLELLNIKIKPSALYQFDLPIEVKYGRIGKLKINLSWRKIMSEAAVLEIEDLYVLCGPFEDKIHDPKRIEEIFIAHKRKQLQEIEKIDEAQLFENDDEQSYTEMITNTIINNIQIYIKNIHIRYEDKYSIMNKVVSFGIYLKEFRAETVDAEGRPNFLNAEEKIVYKMGTLTGFNVYWNSNSKKNSLIIQQKEFDKNRDFCVNFLKESIDTGQILGVQFDKFLEKNLSLESRLTLRRSIDVSQPKIIFQSSVNAIELLFQRSQYKNIIAIVDVYSLLNVHKQFVKYRPQAIENAKDAHEKVRLYWQYVFTATAESKWRSYKCDRMLMHWSKYKMYIEKYRDKLRLSFEKKTVPEQAIKDLQDLEKDLTLESILDAREYCYDELQSKQALFNDSVTEATEKPIEENRPINYVEFRLQLNVPLVGLRLINRGHDILRFSFTHIVSRFETRPVAKSIYFLVNTRSVDAFGIYYKDKLKPNTSKTELVPMIRSKQKNAQSFTPTGGAFFATETSEEMFFTLAFETNPISIEENVEFSIRTRVQSLEVYYEKTCITELLNFFKSDTFGIENVVNIKKIQENVWSKAGVIFAVENHKQFHVSAELSSPYFVIPAKGTMQEPGQSIVFFLGKTLIQSDLHAKKAITSATDVSELEENFYDKLKLNVNEVQVMLIPYNINMADYLDNCSDYGFKYHLLYPVSTDNVLYLSIDPKYKKLPKMKIDAHTPSIHLNFSDNKIIKLVDFGQNFPLPTMPKYATSPSSIGAPVPRAAVVAVSSIKERGGKIKATRKNKKKKKKKDDSDDETDDEEWDGPFLSPKKINGNPIKNYSQLMFKFKIADFVIDIKGTDDLTSENPIENDYLAFILNSIKLDFCITKYGFALKAGLGNLRLLDKLHISRDNHFTEFLSSISNEELIQLRFRQVEKEAPNFEKLYSKTLSKILFKCSKVQVVCHRTAIIYFINYALKLTDKVTIGKPAEIPGTVADSTKPAASDLVAKKNNQSDDDGTIELNVEAVMNELTWKMFDNEMMFGTMQIKDLCATYCLGGIKTDLQVRLKTIYINYENTDDIIINSTHRSKDTSLKIDASNFALNESNDLSTGSKILNHYKQIISCTAEENAENFFDFRLIFFDISSLAKSNEFNVESFKDSIYLNIGKIRVICLVKFVNELINFIEPIVNPLPNLATQIKDQAIAATDAVINAINETQQEGKQIFLNINLSSPLLIIPQNSVSMNAFLVLLGNLTVKNKFIKISHEGEKTTIDEISLFLKDVEVKRIKYKKQEPNLYHERESVVLPINLTAKVLRTLTESKVLPDLNISLSLTNLDSSISLITLKLLFAILDENLNEGISKDDANTLSAIQPPEVDLSPQTSTIGSNSEAKALKKLDEDLVDSPTSNKLSMELHVVVSQINLKIIELKIKSVPDATDQVEKIDFSFLQISQVDFDYFKRANTSWDAYFKMRALNLKDTRPDSNLAVKEMFMPLDHDAYFIQLVYSTQANLDSSLNFSIDHLRINLCLPYILKLYQIAMEAISSPNKEKTKKPVDKKTSEDKSPAAVVAVPENNTSNVSLTVRATIRLPEVVLFAEPEENDSKILLMQAEIGLSFDSKDGDVLLKIDLNDLGVRLGEYNNAQKLGIPFLSPCDLALEMTQKKGETLAYYKLNVESLLFNMTPTLYQVVMGVIATINKSGTETKQIESVKKKQLEDSEPYVVHFESEAYKLTQKKNKVDEQEEHEENEENQIDVISNKDVDVSIYQKNKDKQTKLLETLELNIKEANIKFCEESSIDLQPLAIVRLVLNGKVSNWTKNLHVKAMIELEATYYNDKISNWEPLIDPVMVNEDDYRPWSISLWFAIEEGGILQPPINDKGLEFIEFPVKDLDYSVLENKLHGTTQEGPSGEQSLIEPPKLMTKASAPVEYSEDLESLIDNNEVEKETLGNASYIRIESNDMLNLNVTPSAYKVIMYLAQITAGSDETEIMENKARHPYKFLNFLGEEGTLIVSPMSILRPNYVIGFDFEMKRCESVQSLYHSTDFKTELNATTNEQRRIRDAMLNRFRSQVETIYDEKYKFCLQLEGFERVHLSLKTDGSYLIQLKEKRGKSVDDQEGFDLLHKKTIDMIKYNIMFRIRTNYGRAKVIFSSPLLIENNCKLKLLILIESNNEFERVKQKFKKFILKEAEFPDIDSGKEKQKTTESTITSNIKKYCVLFELLPSKIYYVPLFFAYNCKLYVTPQNLKYAPALVFDIKGYNLRKDDIKEVNCRRLPNFTNQDYSGETQNEDLLVGTNDIQFVKQLSLNVKSVKNVMPSMHANYRVKLFSPLKLINALPFEFRIDIDNEGTYSSAIKSGEVLYIHLQLSKLTKFQIHVTNYLGTSWVGKINWPNYFQGKRETEKLEMVLAPTTEMYVTNKHLSIYIHYKNPNEFTFYSPYWLVNKSGHPINIKSLDSLKTFTVPDDTILLFDFKDSLKKNKVKMCIKDGQWSKAFSIDAAGTTGAIDCHNNNRVRTLLMRVTMSDSSRAKLVTFAPFLSVANQLDETISIAEWSKQIRNDAAYDWKQINSSESIPFFPRYSDRQLCFMLKTSDNFKSKTFPLENPGRFVLICTSSNPNETIAHKIFTVLISGGNLDPVTIIIRKYQHGDAVAKFVNYCDDLAIKIEEPGQFQQRLNPFESFYFVWPELVTPSHDLFWNVDTANQKIPLNYFFTKSGMETQNFSVDANRTMPSELSSESEINEDYERSLIRSKSTVSTKINPYLKPEDTKKKVNVYCVSYVEGTQRIILFTNDFSLAEIERRKEAASMEIFISLKGMQISLINNMNLEISTIGIIDSVPQWILTNSVAKKWFNQENSLWLDKKYLQNLVTMFKMEKLDNSAIEESERFLANFDINFDKMQMIKPEKGQLKRFWQPGMKVQYRTSTNLMSLKCSIYKLQIDNQLPDSYFPISFYKAPISQDDTNPKYVPFLTLDMFTEQQEVIQIYRYFDCLLQEFYLKVDKGFLLSIKDWYDAAILKSDIDDEMFERDLEEMEEPENILVIVDSFKEMIDKIKSDIKLTKQIMEFKTLDGNVKQSAHIRFDNFRLSPITFNLSFSVNGTVHTDDKEVATKSTDFILYFLLESIGSTISEFKDVKFHFNAFEIDNHDLTWNDMYNDIFNHYKIQVLHQAYVLIFGLDVLGNPFGLVSDFSKGLTDLFYDPLISYLKHSDGENKIELEMGFKIKATVNKTISSFAGSGSLITGSVGRVLATMSFDKEYKRKRQFKLSRCSTEPFKETLTLAGKNIVAGMVYGVIGIVKNPIEEFRISKKYLIKGVGKGISGLVVKPMGSVFDGISISLDGLKRFAQSGSEPIRSMRLPRHLIKNVPIIPFSKYLAEGYEILRDLQNDHIAVQEAYWAHFFFQKKTPTLYFITDAKIYQLHKTHTQILKKWRLNEKPISLSKIAKIEVIKRETDLPDLVTNPRLKFGRKKPPTLPKILQEQVEQYDLFIKFVEDEIFDRNKPELDRKLLITTNCEKAEWLAEKIECVIKYYKEARNKMVSGF